MHYFFLQFYELFGVTTLQKNSWIITKNSQKLQLKILLKTKMISLLIQNAFPVSSEWD